MPRFKQYTPEEIGISLFQKFNQWQWEEALRSISGMPQQHYGIKEEVDLKQALAYLLFDHPELPVNGNTGKLALGQHREELGEIFQETVIPQRMKP